MGSAHILPLTMAKEKTIMPGLVFQSEGGNNQNELLPDKIYYCVCCSSEARLVNLSTLIRQF